MNILHNLFFPESAIAARHYSIRSIQRNLERSDLQSREGVDCAALVFEYAGIKVPIDQINLVMINILKRGNWNISSLWKAEKEYFDSFKRSVTQTFSLPYCYSDTGSMRTIKRMGDVVAQFPKLQIIEINAKVDLGPKDAGMFSRSYYDDQKTVDFYTTLLEKNRHIREVSIQGAVSPKLLNRIVQVQPELTSLKISQDSDPRRLSSRDSNTGEYVVDPNLSEKMLSGTYSPSHIALVHQLPPEEICNAVQKLSDLKELQIVSQRLTNSHMATIAKFCPRLEVLRVIGSRKITSLAWTKDLPLLRELDLTGSNLPSQEIRQLSTCIHLNFVSLQGAIKGNTSTQDLITGCPHANVLNIKGCHIAPTEIPAFANMERLQKLAIGDFPGSNQLNNEKCNLQRQRPALKVYYISCLSEAELRAERELETRMANKRIHGI